MKTSQDNVELFPYESFGVRLEHINEKRICWFKDDYELQKYLERYKLDKRTIKIDYRDGEPVVRSKKHKRDVEQKSEPKSKGSSGTVRKRKPRVDSPRNTAGTTKHKKRLV
jgi:hypothetical protein